MKGRLTLLLKGGLGNQLFQLGAAAMAAEEMGRELQVSLGSYLINRARQSDALRLYSALKCANALETILWAPLTIEKIASLRALGDSVLSDWNAQGIGMGTKPRWRWASGYFQHQRFTEAVATALRQHLGNQAPVAGPYVAVHVRRTDFLLEEDRAQEYAAMMRDYYGPAIRQAKAALGQSCAVVLVSDDIPAALADLSGAIGGETRNLQALPSGDVWSDLACLANADALVCSNSTYAWWAGRVSCGAVFLAERWVQRERSRPGCHFDLRLRNATLI